MTTKSRSRSRLTARDESYSPFSLVHQGIDEMEHWFDAARRRFADITGSASPGGWSPAIEAFQRGDEFVVRVELPGLTRHDLTVEAGDDVLTISGERRQEQQDERDGAFWTERSYGSFRRAIPLPAGAIGDSAKATFNNGVLEVVMQAPPQETRRGRKIDISGGKMSG